MGSFVNSGNSAFQVALNSEIYVDKTGLLEYTNKVMDTTAKFICSSRPRRFGKSITADMLTAYYCKGCDSQRMFSGLSISKSPDFRKHLNQYDVIHLDIQWCMEPSGGAEHVLSYITEKTIEELKEYYSHELPDNICSLPEALSRINTATGRKFVVIIDEWDVLIRDEAMNQNVQDEYINFLRGMFKGTEPTKYIQLAYLTGILPIKKIRTQSALNNFDEFTMIDAGILAPYTGFTEAEVQELCNRYGRDFEQVKRWYDGYVLEGYQVYNPFAVVKLMTKGGGFKSYWSETGTYEAIVPLINRNFDGLKTSIIEMLSGASVKIQVKYFQNDTVSFKNKDDVLTYLIHLGYLGYDQCKKAAFVPNEEIRQELTTAVESTKWSELLDFQQKSDDLLDATLDMDAEAVAAGIENIHTEYASSIQYNNENSLSSVLTIAYLSAMQYYFKPVRELPTGRGFADFVFIPKMEYVDDYPALVIELKWGRNAQTAMQQIKEKRYPASIEHYTGRILLVGISYDKKTKEHHCVIEKYEKPETCSVQF
ncbi:MAG: AAA family ATPase [Lachnospiraceae bacterium]